MAGYTWSTTTPYLGEAVTDIDLALAPGMVVAVVQKGRASLYFNQWVQPTELAPLAWLGSVELATGVRPRLTQIAAADAALAGGGLQPAPGVLAALATDSGQYRPTGTTIGGIASLSTFVRSEDAPTSSGDETPSNPAGRPGPGVVQIGPVGKRVVVVRDVASPPDLMSLEFWNVPYQTFTSLEEPSRYYHITATPKRRPSVVGLQEVVDGIWLKSADAVVASADASDHLELRRYHLVAGASASITAVGQSATTADLVKEISTIAVPDGEGFVLVTAIVNSTHQLKLIAWKCAASGPPVLWFEQFAGDAAEVEAIHIRNRDFAVGVVDPSGNAAVRYWRLPEPNQATPQCQPLTQTGGVPDSKAIRLVHRVSRGAEVGHTYVAVHREDGTYRLHTFVITET